VEKPKLQIDFCNNEATRYACKHWHYSKSVPCPPLVKFGVWENEAFIGCVLFARGASSNLLKPYGLEPTQGAELVRIALRDHATPVSRMISISVRLLKRHCPGLRLLISFADPVQGHVGGVYQASGWTYTGQSQRSSGFRDKTGRVWHERMVSERGWNYVFGEKRKVVKPSECEKIELPGKHRYLLPLDKEMLERIEVLRKPYPKAVDAA